MIDKVDVRIPARAPYTREFGQLRHEILGSNRDPFKPSVHYCSSGDLRKLGYRSILHSVCRHGTEGTHKLEIVDAGVISLTKIQHEIERVFDVDARRLGIMRLDLAADVHDLPVSWFSVHIRARWKRFVCDYGEFSRMGKREIETVYFGKRPNCYRIYNKIAECKNQYARLKRDADAGYPSFEEVFGYPESGAILTRIERQIGGSRVPTEVDTFGKLHCLRDFNPFVRLEFVSGGQAAPSIEQCRFEQYAIGMFLRSLVESRGIHRLRRWLNQHANRNAGRLLNTYREFLPIGGHLTAEQLFDTYRQSVSKQLAA